MLEIYVNEIEVFNDVTLEFTNFKAQTLQLEHSLVSLSKWESKWCKSFLNTDKTREETLDYIRCMTINTKQVDERVYPYLPDKVIDEINDYINAPMTATTIKKKGTASNEIITNELIYYWMIAFQIPVEFEKWHLKRLLTLINVCDAKNQKPSKMSDKEILSSQAELNMKRRAALNSKG